MSTLKEIQSETSALQSRSSDYISPAETSNFWNIHSKIKKIIASIEAQYKLEKELHIFLRTFQIYILKTKCILKQMSSQRHCFKQPVVTALQKKTEECSILFIA